MKKEIKNKNLPAHAKGRIDSSAPFDKRIILPLWQSFTTTDILFLSEVNSRISKASYWTVEPLNLISAIYQWKLYHVSYNQNQFLMTVKRKCSLPRILAFLLTKTICSWAAAWTRASSSWDCALYTILPFLLQEDGRKILL